MRRLLMAAAIAAFALTAVAGAVLVVVSSPSESRRLAATSPDGRVEVMIAPVSAGQPRTVVIARDPSELPIPAPAPGFPVLVSAESDDSGFDARIPGLIVLIAGLAGVLTLTSLGLLRASRLAV